MPHFLMFFQPRPLWIWLMETRYMPKELGLFYDVLLTVPLYIWWDQFIMFQLNITTPSHEVPSNFMLDFKRLRLWLCWPSSPLLGITLPESKHSGLSSKRNFLSHPSRNRIIVVPTVYLLSKENISQLIYQRFGNVSITRLKKIARTGLMEGLAENTPDLE